MIKPEGKLCSENIDSHNNFRILHFSPAYAIMLVGKRSDISMLDISKNPGEPPPGFSIPSLLELHNKSGTMTAETMLCAYRGGYDGILVFYASLRGADSRSDDRFWEAVEESSAKRD